jgi:hypothetical protein
MIPLSTARASATSGTLTWSRFSCDRRHELRRNGEVVGELKRPSFWSASFIAETQHGSWRFRRSGFWGNVVEVADQASAEPVASFQAGYSRAALTFADGQVFQLTHQGWWRPVWTVVTESGQPLLYVHVREKKVELAAGAPELGSRLLLPILFTWYRVGQAEQDAANAALTVMVVVAT